ncbi:major facilitator superfamily domain-containing protein [Xylariales sp. PMI_506]|nr:major facilitator superfamily domain-containing protein [Xylariales sp. PMI_506]
MASPRISPPANHLHPPTPESEGKTANNEQDIASKSFQKDEPGEEPEWVTGLKLVNIIAAVTLVCLLTLLDAVIIATAIPQITNDFHSLIDIGWYGAAYQLGSASFMLLTGKLYMIFSSKWIFLSFFFIFELGSLICGIATSSKILIIGRAIAGLGSSGILNGCFVLIAGCVPLEKRPSIIGYIIGIANIGVILGPLVGGALTEYASWRWCFYINLPIGGLVAAMLVFIHVPDQVPKPSPMSCLPTLHTKLDLVGFVFFAPAAIQFLLALQYGGNQFAWNSPQIIGLFCGAAGTLAVFLMWEYRKGDKAMFPLAMLKKTTVWSSFFVYGLFMAQLFCVNYYLPVYFQGVLGATPLMSGVYLLPSVLSQLTAAVAFGRLVEKVGFYLPFAFASAAFVSIGNGLLSTLSPGTSTGKWIGYQILLGFGRGLGMQIPILAVQNTLPPAQISVAMAIVMFSQSFHGSIFLTLCETIFSTGLRTLIPEYAPSVNPQDVISAGANGFRTIISPEDLPNVLTAYAKSLDRVFYLTTGMGVGCFILTWWMGWKDIRKKKEVSKA